VSESSSTKLLHGIDSLRLNYAGLSRGISAVPPTQSLICSFKTKQRNLSSCYVSYCYSSLVIILILSKIIHNLTILYLLCQNCVSNWLRWVRFPIMSGCKKLLTGRQKFTLKYSFKIVDVRFVSRWLATCRNLAGSYCLSWQITVCVASSQH